MPLNKIQDSQYQNQDSRLDLHTSNQDVYSWIKTWALESRQYWDL